MEMAGTVGQGGETEEVSQSMEVEVGVWDADSSDVELHKLAKHRPRPKCRIWATTW